MNTKIWHNKKIQNLILSLGMAFAFFTIMTPIYISRSTVYGEYDVYIRMAVVFSLYFIYAKEWFKEKNIDVFLIIFHIYAAISFFVTLQAKADIVSALWSRWIVDGAFLILFALCLKRNAKLFLMSVYTILFLLIIWDAKTTLVPKALWGDEFSNLLFGNYNSKAAFYFPALLFGYVACILNKENRLLKISYIFLQILIISVLAYVKSITSFTIFILSIIYCDFLNKKYFYKIFNIYTCLLANIVFFLSAVLCSYGREFSAFVVKFLGKTSSFNTRAQIWDATKLAISKRPFCGYGIYSPDERKNLIEGCSFIHAHNMYLNTVFETGLIGFLCLVAMAVLAVRRIMINVKNVKIKNAVLILFGLYLFACQFEVYSELTLLSFLAFMYYFRDSEELYQC